ncbi:MAG: hypothetical protein IJA10_10140 [Lachnospiraceae bacterium]|nr:hypothetical protein [Lachnospiraceae bacterium]
MIDNALDFEGLKYNNEKVKLYIKDEIEKETTRATEVENNKVNKTTVATSSTLGLIKSGEDITVDKNGNVSVNDNSHNHTLSNLSDLLTTADELNVLSGITVNTMEINHLKDSTGNIQEQLNNKAPLDSPVLTGTPQAPTAETGNNTTQVATTEFVQNEISNLGERASAKYIYNTKTTSSYAHNNPQPDNVGVIYDNYIFTIPFHSASTGREQYGSYIYETTSVDSGEKSLLINDGLYYLTDEGTASKLGYSELVLGNNKWSNIDTGDSREGNKYGAIRLYGVGNGSRGISNNAMTNCYVRITTEPLTYSRIIRLPDANGTIALTTSNVASADVATKATQDASGNIITKTYAPIDSPTFKNYIKIGNTEISINSFSMEGCSADDCSIAYGYYASAASYSRAGGSMTYANGLFSVAEGQNVTADGKNSHAIGYGTYTPSEATYQFAIGRYNNSTTATSDTVFVIGNGWNTTSAPRSNAFRVTFDGVTYATGEYTTSGADYAEFFEWLDGNINEEDRRGYFVTLDGDKIRIANSNDYIIGIISGQPSVVGNGDEDWMGRYILDDFGSYIYEEFKYIEKDFNEETKEIITVTKTGTRPKQNPNYDSSKPYTQRKDRPEWDYVGMLGVLSVRDDGTCKVNGYCKVADGGIATASDTGYRVIKRVTDSVVKIILK